MDFEKTIQFLLEQQARLDAEFNDKLDAHKARFEEEMSRVNSVLVDLATAQERTNAILATLVEKHIELAESHKDLAESHKDLAESHRDLAASHRDLAESHRDLAESHKDLAGAQKATEQNLNVLISTVERHIANHS